MLPTVNMLQEDEAADDADEDGHEGAPSNVGRIPGVGLQRPALQDTVLAPG